MMDWTNLLLLIMLIIIGITSYNEGIKLEKKRFRDNLFNIVFLGIIYMAFCNFIEINTYGYLFIRVIFINFLVDYYLRAIDKENLLNRAMVYSLFVSIFFLNLYTGYFSIFKSRNASLELLPSTVLMGMYIGYFYTLGYKYKDGKPLTRIMIFLMAVLIVFGMNFIQYVDIYNGYNNILFFGTSFVLFLILFLLINNSETIENDIKIDEGHLIKTSEVKEHKEVVNDYKEENKKEEDKAFKKDELNPLLDFDIIALERV